LEFSATAIGLLTKTSEKIGGDWWKVVLHEAALVWMERGSGRSDVWRRELAGVLSGGLSRTTPSSIDDSSRGVYRAFAQLLSRVGYDIMCGSPNEVLRMSSLAVGRMVCTFALMAVSCASSDSSGDNSSERWRNWFERRQFGEDPYFFFPSGATGPTGCPANERLSYGGRDSVGVQLEVIDDRASQPQVRARCTVRFDELEGEPEVRALPDGRAMWALRARRAR
jgi:hypothetical protein